MAYLETPSDFATTAAYRHAQMSKSTCEAELKKRKIAFRKESALGVLAPVRLVGPLSGVWFHGPSLKEQQGGSPHEIVDCRLVLSLDDATKVLERHGVVEVRHLSMYRLPPKSWPKRVPATRHLGALAIDAATFVKKDGTTLDVDRDFHGKLDAKVCGPDARPRPATDAALALRALLCDLVAARLFNVVLTPNYDPPHKNHFHLEVTAGKKWFLLH